ncbi:MAG: hypothetical protein V1833_02145 [Elusimicrobiota bacterium]
MTYSAPQSGAVFGDIVNKIMENLNSQIVIYKDQNGNIKIDVQFDGNTVWLTQDTIATLYDKGRSTVTEHI